MGALSRAMTLALSVGLVGCTLKSVPFTAEAPLSIAPMASSEASLTPLSEEATSPQAEYGWLNLTIRWPEPEAGYNIALLPTTTQAIAVWVKKDGKTIGEPVLISRAPGIAKVTKSLRVEAAMNLSVEVKAYREAAPDLSSALPIAQTSGVVNVTRSKVTPLPLTLTPMNVPAIGGFSSNIGRVGDTIAITGSNFGGSEIPIPTVTFNGVGTSVTRNSETSLTVVVPSGAKTGIVTVKADGVESTSNTPFWVLSSFEIEAPRQSWDTASPLSSRLVLYGQTLQFTGRESWVVKDGETASQYGAPPVFTWSASNPAAGSLDGDGLFTAATTFATASIKAAFGGLSSNALEVRAVGVDAVTLDRSTLTLNALSEDGSADPGYVTSATLVATVQTTAPFNNGVTWTSSDTGLVTVTNGLVQTIAGAPEGTAIITATSVDDPKKKATASVTVTILGDLELGIE